MTPLRNYLGSSNEAIFHLLKAQEALQTAEARYTESSAFSDTTIEFKNAINTVLRAYAYCRKVDAETVQYNPIRVNRGDKRNG